MKKLSTSVGSFYLSKHNGNQRKDIIMEFVGSITKNGRIVSEDGRFEIRPVRNMNRFKYAVYDNNVKNKEINRNLTYSLEGAKKTAKLIANNNPYYREKVHPEEKKLIAMQVRSHLLFYVYYRLLWWYRDTIRRG